MGGPATRWLALVVAMLSAGCGDPVGFVTPGDPEGTARPESRERRGSLLYRAILEVAREDAVGARVEIVNQGSSAQALRFPDTCVAMLRAYFAPSGFLAWDHRQGKTRCQDEILEITIAPGDTLVVSPRVAAIAVLGTSLPNGSYRFTTYLIPIGEPEIELPLGEVRLALP